VPEEYEVLNIFGPDVHDHVSTRTALLQFFGFWAMFAGVCYGFYHMAPKKIAVPRVFPYNGLSKEQGGDMWRVRPPPLADI
jgi:NADH dehydrogenase (ubiquinone) 1 beta subcomplex subunit 8